MTSEQAHTINYGKQTINENDISSVCKILYSEMLTQGEAVDTFENDLKNYFCSKNACAVANGTAALHLTGLALGWRTGDVVITSPITFLSTANCIVYAGATPDFVDIDPVSYTINPNKLEDRIKYYQSKGVKVKAAIGVDFAGHPCDWISLREIADKYDLQLVNDNCHAMGASYYGNKNYGLRYADVVTQSYHPVKNITTGEGGSVLTNDLEVDEKVRNFRAHGVIKSPEQLEKNDGPWYYEMKEVGYNYRITDFQCALGSSQIKKLDDFVQRRREIAERYDLSFSIIDNLKIPITNNTIEHAYHLYPLQINFDKISLTKKVFFEKIKKMGIELQVHYIPIYLQPFYKKKYGFKSGYCPIAENFYESEFSIPMYPSLKDDEVRKVSNSIIKCINSK